jgi:hypothetical protein
MPSQITFRTSWIAYVGPILSLLFWLAFIAGGIWFYENNPSISSIMIYIFIISLSIWFFRIIWKVSLLRSKVLTIYDRKVCFNYGILPWRKTSLQWHCYQIFSSECRNPNSFWCWVCRYGTLVIIGKEGSTKEYSISLLHNPNRACGIINTMVDRHYDKIAKK